MQRKLILGAGLTVLLLVISLAATAVAGGSDLEFRWQPHVDGDPASIESEEIVASYRPSGPGIVSYPWNGEAYVLVGDVTE